ncbi:very long-chain specific acyl-CoA dehydrogenase, mitochondrial-like [Uloborus diversus]|uniref:very long-chain specific acyl-CoA dehydrogenase, mitochondrial-like n=1 Tax=Uloborus diversus TaxID=327109 RepID=UPI00240A354C|nr:very long-chain specific acyl-CoA dehydrogenase, mitochondrial-like [Uloborus diversus]
MFKSFRRFLWSRKSVTGLFTKNRPKKIWEEKIDASKSFVMSLFKSCPEIAQVFPFPNVMQARDKENLEAMVNTANKFLVEMNDAAKNDERSKFGETALKKLAELGFCGLQVPEQYGGLGLSSTQYARLIQEIGGFDLALGVTLGAHQAIGFKGILLYGNDDQKKKYLPPLAAGKRIAAFCLTEKESGSDVKVLKSRAIPSPDKTHFILNGSKLWITNGGIADIFTVFAQVPVETPSGIAERMTAFIVERGFGGVKSGKPEQKMGIKASNTTEVFFDDCKIPSDNIIGEIGDGFKIAMNIVNSGRFGMAAILSGTMKAAIAEATKHAANRLQFGRLICHFGAIQEKIVRMCMAQYTAESMAYMIAGNMDKNCADFHLEAAITKIFASEAAWYVVDEAIQILGGNGYMTASGLERVLRDLRVFRIFEGTNEVLRVFVALSGFKYAREHFEHFQELTKSPSKGTGLVLKIIAKLLKRTWGLDGQRFAKTIHPDLEDSAHLLSKCINEFGDTSELLLAEQGKNITNNQFLLTRITNSVIDVYAMACVLSRATYALNESVPSAAYEGKMAKLICTEASERIFQNSKILRSSDKLTNFKQISSLAEDIVKFGGVIQCSPLEV